MLVEKERLEKMARGQLNLIECRAVAESILADDMFNKMDGSIKVEPEVSLRYWVCIIGVADHNKLPAGADSPMRMAVRNKFEELTGKEDDNCWSGWGTDEKLKNKIMKAWNS